MKSLREVSWNVTEEEYRSDPAISYSALSTFAREGHTIVPFLYDKKDAEALRFGSLVDTLITEPNTVDDRFCFASIPKMVEEIRKITDILWEKYHEEYRSLSLIPSTSVNRVIEEIGYLATTNWSADTKVRRVKEGGDEYYKLKVLSQNKIIISEDDKNKAELCVEELQTNPYTRDYFVPNPFTPEVELFFQLKFKLDNAPRPVRCMFDVIEVNHEKKTIQPLDLKTTGKPEYKFYESFLTWRYDLQATLYTYILSEILKQDDYFKTFKILPFTFICINRDSRSPLLWEYPECFLRGDRVDNSGSLFKSWQTLLEELHYHMESGQFKYSLEAVKNNGRMKLTNLKLA